MSMRLLSINEAVTRRDSEDAEEAILAGRLQEQDPPALARRVPVAHPSSFILHHPLGRGDEGSQTIPERGRSV